MEAVKNRIRCRKVEIRPQYASDLFDKNRFRNGDTMENLKLNISSNNGMSQEVLKQNLSEKKGVVSFFINENKIRISFNEYLTSEDAIKNRIRESGFLIVSDKKKERKWLGGFIDRIAESNKKTYGSKKPDCCG